MVLPVAVTIVVGVGVALIFYGLYNHVAVAVDVIEQRLGRYTSPAPSVEAAARQNVGKLTTAINTFVDRQGFSDRLRLDLAKADLKMTPGEFVSLRLGLAAAGFAVGFLFVGGIVPALGLAGLCVWAPKLWLRHRQHARERKFMDMLGETVTMMASSLRAGYSMMQALELISREMAAPVCHEFHRVTMEVGVGLPVEEALRHLTERIESTDLQLMITAMNVQREVGGNLAEILDIIGNTIRERQELVGEVRSLTAQGRISAYIITALPIFVGLAMFVLNRPYISALWTTTFGYFLSGLCTVLIVIGFFATRKVAQVEV